MFLYVGGSSAGRGKYWSPADGTTVVMEREAGTLPGGRDRCYLRLPESYALLALPLVGLLLAVAFPFGLGLVLLVFLLAAVGVWGAAKSGIEIYNTYAGEVMMFGWNPATAYLAGRKGLSARGPRKDRK